MGKTIIEKIIGDHSGKPVCAGDTVTCSVDACFSNDNSSIDVFNALSLIGGCVKKPSMYSLFIDHAGPAPTVTAAKIHSQMREFCRETGACLFDAGCGISHQVMAQKGIILPGKLIVGADSGALIAGAFGAVGLSVTGQALAQTLISGNYVFTVPQTVQVIINGKLSAGIHSFDIALYLAKNFSQDLSNSAIEFTGDTIASLSMDGRCSLTAMAVGLKAVGVFICPDAKTIAWLKKAGIKSGKSYFADKNCVYKKIITINAADICSLTAGPRLFSNISRTECLKTIKINQAVIGTCSNGRMEDLEIAAKILKNKKINSAVRLFIIPASRDIFEQALEKGIIRILSGAGAIIQSPGCGPCAGVHQGILADGETAIMTANRNTLGCMSNPNSFVYLASPVCVAVSALTGKITDPCGKKRG